MEGFTLLLFCFCKWWWLLWLLPAILGWLLGSSMGSWKGKYESAMKDLEACKAKRSSLEDELAACKAKRSSLEDELAACKARTSTLEADLSASKQASAHTGFAAMPTPPAPEPPKRTGAWAKLKDDNLQFIEGIGPKMNEVLIENGISSWAKLADQSREGLKAILDKYGDKYKIIEPGDWPIQAKYAVDGDWDGLIKYQSDDGSAAKVRNLFIKFGIMDEDGNYKA